MPHVFPNCCKTLHLNGVNYNYFAICELNPSVADNLPYSIRVLLECAVRNCDGFLVRPEDVENIVNWQTTQHQSKEIPFLPSRVILQDFTGVPAVVDFAAMRDAVKRLGGDPAKVNPVCPADLVIDHSVQVDEFGSNSALRKNQEIEFERNKERFRFLKWGSKALDNMLIVPPGSGIVHQVNLEYLARVVFGCGEAGQGSQSRVLYPDSVVGTDSHTTMINGLGVLGWGVGGIEAEAVMLGQPIGMILPQVVGFKMTGQLPQLTTCTDLVLTVTKMLRDLGVVGKFVEFFGPGVAELSIADRATLSNMCPEYGATVGFFPVDEQTMDYLRQTGRDESKLPVIEQYLKENKMFRNYRDSRQDPIFTEVVELDLSTVVSSVSGPKRPQDQVPVTMLKSDFIAGLTAKTSFKGYGIKPDAATKQVDFEFEGVRYRIGHGAVVIAAITSCTNTSNPSVMIGAGIMAKNAIDKGLSVLPYVKTSLSPGSGVVTKYLEKSGLIPYLEKLGFYTAGYGCMTCIGNSGPLPDPVGQAIESNDLVVSAVLSGNRNFEGRVHPLTRANYLASPPLVVAYALAGRVDIDFDKEPIGTSGDGTLVFLKDIFPTRQEVEKVVQANILPEMFREVYGSIQNGNASWNTLEVTSDKLYPWDAASSYIKNPPFFADMEKSLPKLEPIRDAYVLLNLGDFVTTDHISPAGAISRTSPAARYLGGLNITPKDFNTYGARRGNDAVMARGTFANIRIVNKFLSKPGPRTLYLPTGEEMDIYDAAMRYADERLPVIVLTGKDYGSGSSRDWAAKGPFLLGIKAVIAESYERIHRSNLIGMGIVPLQYLAGQNADALGLSGKERFSIDIPQDIKPGQILSVELDNGKSFQVLSRFDTEVELTYYRNGGILQYMIRNM